jgi:hypothetical protein
VRKDSGRLRLPALWLVIAAAPALPAQEVSPDTAEIAPGDAVRITAPALGLKGWKGWYVRAELDSVTLRGKGDSATRTLPLAEIARFEVNHGNKPLEGHAAQGALLGGLAGGLLGMISQPGSDDSECNPIDGAFYCSGAQWKGGVVGAGIGALIGLGIGALIRTTPWREVPINPPEVTGHVSPRGDPGLMVTLRF